MAEVNDVDDHSKALSGGNYERWNVLPEHFDHLVYHQLSNRVQNRKYGNISQNFLVRSKEDKNINQFKRKNPID